MVDPGPVVAVPLASRLSAVNLRRQAVQVDHEPLRQPAVVHGPDPPSREPRKPVAKHLGVLPLPQRRHHPRGSVGCDASARPKRHRPRPIAHPEAEGRVSPRNAPASLWSRRHWAARRSAVRSSSVIVCRILRPSRASRIRFAIQRTTPLRRSTSRPVTAPASPVIRSPRTSILSDL